MFTKLSEFGVGLLRLQGYRAFGVLEGLQRGAASTGCKAEVLVFHVWVYLRICGRSEQGSRWMSIVNMYLYPQ